jgi:hypothetical protein
MLKQKKLPAESPMLALRSSKGPRDDKRSASNSYGIKKVAPKDFDVPFGPMNHPRGFSGILYINVRYRFTNLVKKRNHC